MTSCTPIPSDRPVFTTRTDDRSILSTIAEESAPIIITDTPEFNNTADIDSNLFLTGTPSAGDSTTENNQTTQTPGTMSELSIFGIHLPVLSSNDISLVQQAGGNWLRRDLKWYLIEEVAGKINWNDVADLEREFLVAAKAGMKVVVILGGTPEWALKGGYSCGAIAPDKLNEFGNFVYETVKRYSAPPYNIKYWELYNEPDTAGILGCWGDPDDRYFGGAYYGEMLRVIYPKVKEADVSSKVMIGGLLLDCDPRPASNWCKFWGHDDKPPKFLEGILQNDGGNYFDGISFHGYDYFDYTDPQFGEYLNPNWGNSWNGYLYDGKPGDRNGPVTIYKADYIYELLNKYYVTSKFLMNTENALICGAPLDPPGGDGCESTNESIFEQTKAIYLTQAYAAAIVKNLDANIWFSLYGWRNSGLLNQDLSPRPAYYAYDIASEEIGGATFSRNVSSFPGVQIYEFTRNNKTIWLIWSLDDLPHTITLPSTPDEVKDFMGVVKTPASTFTVTLDPHYLIWYP